jgi:transposase
MHYSLGESGVCRYYENRCPSDPKTLPQDPETLQKIVVDLTTQLDRTERLLRQLPQAKTGRKSEQLSREQLALFAAEAGLALSPAEPEQDQDLDDEPPSSSAGASAGKPRGRKPLPRHLKRERVEHDLPESEKHCEECGQDLRRIGEEVSERYEYIPAQMKVIEDGLNPKIDRVEREVVAAGFFEATFITKGDRART